MNFSLNEVDSSWHPLFRGHLSLINSILSEIESSDFTPARQNIFRAFTTPLEAIRVVIIGQDPYPGAHVADGLAFSSPSGNPIPASLNNIFKEYVADTGYEIPVSAELTPWKHEGVMLLNRTLTTIVGERNAHLGSQWKEFTLAVAKELGARNVVAILWGRHAQDLSPYFTLSIESPHPSPLSARRGFFGSKPFSRANQLLIDSGRDPVNWKLI